MKKLRNILLMIAASVGMSVQLLGMDARSTALMPISKSAQIMQWLRENKKSLAIVALCNAKPVIDIYKGETNQQAVMIAAISAGLFAASRPGQIDIPQRLVAFEVGFSVAYTFLSLVKDPTNQALIGSRLFIQPKIKSFIAERMPASMQAELQKVITALDNNSGKLEAAAAVAAFAAIYRFNRYRQNTRFAGFPILRESARDMIERTVASLVSIPSNNSLTVYTSDNLITIVGKLYGNAARILGWWELIYSLLHRSKYLPRITKSGLEEAIKTGNVENFEKFSRGFWGLSKPSAETLSKFYNFYRKNKFALAEYMAKHHAQDIPRMAREKTMNAIIQDYTSGIKKWQRYHDKHLTYLFIDQLLQLPEDERSVVCQQQMPRLYELLGMRGINSFSNEVLSAVREKMKNFYDGVIMKTHTGIVLTKYLDRERSTHDAITHVMTAGPIDHAYGDSQRTFFKRRKFQADKKKRDADRRAQKYDRENNGALTAGFTQLPPDAADTIAAYLTGCGVNHVPLMEDSLRDMRRTAGGTQEPAPTAPSSTLASSDKGDSKRS